MIARGERSDLPADVEIFLLHADHGAQPFLAARHRREDGDLIAGAHGIARLGVGLVHRHANGAAVGQGSGEIRSEEHTSELQSLMRSSYAVFCLKKKNKHMTITNTTIRSIPLV